MAARIQNLGGRDMKLSLDPAQAPRTRSPESRALASWYDGRPSVRRMWAIREARGLRVIVTLGRISHESTLAALGRRRAAAPFRHGAAHEVGKLRLLASYHCSRYNTNTGVLTPEMFRGVFAAARAYLDARSQASTSSAFLSGGKTG